MWWRLGQYSGVYPDSLVPRRRPGSSGTGWTAGSRPSPGSGSASSGSTPALL